VQVAPGQVPPASAPLFTVMVAAGAAAVLKSSARKASAPIKIVFRSSNAEHMAIGVCGIHKHLKRPSLSLSKGIPEAVLQEIAALFAACLFPATLNTSVP
jgi:hypothetical protein